MCLSFQNILILSDPCNAVIHLFHVENKTQHGLHPIISASSEIRLLQIKENIRDAHEYIQVEIHIISGGTVQSQIIRKARQLLPGNAYQQYDTSAIQCADNTTFAN